MITKNDPRRVGGTYRSGYWGQTYVVRSITAGAITAEWDDGRVTTHATPWDARRDQVVAVTA